MSQKTDEAKRFLRDLTSDKDLLVAYASALVEAGKQSDFDAFMTSFLDHHGYHTDFPTVEAALNLLPQHAVGYWVGTYSVQRGGITADKPMVLAPTQQSPGFRLTLNDSEIFAPLFRNASISWQTGTHNGTRGALGFRVTTSGGKVLRSFAGKVVEASGSEVEYTGTATEPAGGESGGGGGSGDSSDLSTLEKLALIATVLSGLQVLAHGARVFKEWREGRRSSTELEDLQEEVKGLRENVDQLSDRLDELDGGGIEWADHFGLQQGNLPEPPPPPPADPPPDDDIPPPPPDEDPPGNDDIPPPPDEDPPGDDDIPPPPPDGGPPADGEVPPPPPVEPPPEIPE